MDLKSPHPFWSVANGLLATYPTLDRHVRCDVVILGAGLTGAILAERLTREGRSVVVLDRREAGQGSTCASTAMLMYEIDTHLVDLAKEIGQPAAERAYRRCVEAVAALRELASRSLLDGQFFPRESIYLAAKESEVAELEAEAQARQTCGIRCELLRSGELRERYGLERPGAIVSADAAVCDPLRLTQGLLQAALAGGAQIYDRTEVLKTECSASGVRVATDRGFHVEADDLVFATGYEAQEQLQERVTQLKSSYALVTQPLPSLEPWNENWVLWETARPYLYLRTTPDRRILVGGLDDDFQNAARRDARVNDKSRQLLRAVLQLLPHWPLEVEYAWGGTFGETDDGLAYIGQTPEYPHAYFALGFGGNGITFSAVAADLIAAELHGRRDPDADLFRFGR